MGVRRKAHAPDSGPGSALELLRRMDERRWLAWWSGEPVTAQWLAPRYPESRLDDDGLRERAAALAEIRSPRLVPVRGIAPTSDAWWLVADPSAGNGGVPLRQLRALCELSAPQAAAVARGVLLAVQDLHAAGGAHGSLDEGDLLVGVDGRVRLRGWGREQLLAPDARGRFVTGDLVAVRDLSASLVADVRASRRWSAEQRDEALSELAQAAELVSVDSLGEVLDAWSAALVGSPDEAERVRVELGALVRAIPPEPAPRLPEIPAPRGRRLRARTQQTRPAPRAGDRRESDRSWVWKSLAALCALALVVGLEVGLLGNRIVEDLRTLRAPSPATAATGRTSSPALPSLGPAPRGVLAGLTARTLHACTPAHRCTVTLVVRVHPQPRPTRVTWRVVAQDLCTHRARTLPGGTVTVPARTSTARGVHSVTLPQARGLALGIATTAPVRAASAAIAVPARPRAC